MNKRARWWTFDRIVTTMSVLVMVFFAPVAHALKASEVAAQIQTIQRALDAWRLDDATALARALEAALPDVPPVQSVVGQVKFHQGDYAGAVRLLERALEGGTDPGFLRLVQSTYEETKGYVVRESEHFVFRTPPGKDEVLADWALPALERAYVQITEAFDYQPTRKIVVDVLHDARGLARVSTLTETEIETSGTIALCKYNRLMITSPKALARGYSWLDTLAHELVHLVISEKSANTVPIWLHEGLAKYAETLWRGPPGRALSPASENLLATAVKNGKLITFDQMHPSMAKLPSQEDTALAFAEVFTVVEFVHRDAGVAADDVLGRAGFQRTNQVLDALASGARMDQALRAGLGVGLKGLQKKWMKYLKQRPYELVPGAKPRALTFVKNPRSATQSVDDREEEDALSEAKSQAGKRRVRLGNLLRRRGRAAAAVVEYEKALAEVGTRSPALYNRLAGIYIELGRDREAAQLLGQAVKAFPDDPQTRILVGRTALRTNDLDGARAAYARAAWENPFNPEIYAALHRIGTEKNDATLIEQAKFSLGKLAQHAKAEAFRWPGTPTKNAPFGTLVVHSNPWGALWIDGVPTGLTTPVVDLKLSPGNYRIRVRDDIDGSQASVVVEITEGAETRIEVAPKATSAQEAATWAKDEAERRRGSTGGLSALPDEEPAEAVPHPPRESPLLPADLFGGER